MFINTLIKRQIKIKIYMSAVHPVVVWTVTENYEKELRTFERKILRRIFGAFKEGGN